MAFAEMLALIVLKLMGLAPSICGSWEEDSLVSGQTEGQQVKRFVQE